MRVLSPQTKHAAVRRQSMLLAVKPPTRHHSSRAPQRLELTEARMFPIHVCPDITAVIGARRNGEFFEGVVSVLQGPRPHRQLVVWPVLRVSERQALLDARKAATRLVALWRDQVTLPASRKG